MTTPRTSTEHELLIAQISDLHISTPGSTNDRFFRTPEHLERAVAHLNGLARRPDVVLITGDLVERGELDEYRRLRELLRPLQMPYYVIPGNHDAREPLRSAFADHEHLQSGGEFIHYTVDRWPVRLVALDTTVPGAPGGRMCTRRLDWLEAQLARAPDRPTVVFMHHPPFRTGIAAMDAMGLEGRDALAEVVARHPQVERILCGHLHRPIIRRLGGTVASTCPATAHQLALELVPSKELALVMEPPACMLHLWLGPEGGLVSHLSLIDPAPRPRFTVYDGERWLEGAEPPADFLQGTC